MHPDPLTCLRMSRDPVAQPLHTLLDAWPHYISHFFVNMIVVFSPIFWGFFLARLSSCYETITFWLVFDLILCIYVFFIIVCIFLLYVFVCMYICRQCHFVRGFRWFKEPGRRRRSQQKKIILERRRRSTVLFPIFSVERAEKTFFERRRRLTFFFTIFSSQKGKNNSINKSATQFSQKFFTLNGRIV